MMVLTSSLQQMPDLPTPPVFGAYFTSKVDLKVADKGYLWSGKDLQKLNEKDAET